MTQTQTLKVAAIQCDIEWESIALNIQRAEDLVRLSDAELVIFPEMFATGFSMSSSKISQREDQSIVTAMHSLAVSEGKAIIFSAAIQEGEKFFNRLYFITPEGEIHRYDKRHLFRMAGEHENYSAGTQRLIVEYKGFRICPLVCYDLRFPVFSRGADTYDLLIYIASWPDARSYAWNTLLRARAIENQSYTIGVNRIGDDPKNHYDGNTVILDFLGKPIVEALRDTEHTITAELSLEQLRTFRENFAAHKDADKFTITSL
ncbi:MAG: amidohydrolase [Rikenellaceae bacterium]